MPGGKLEPGESPREGLLREIREELSLSCKPGHLIYEGILPAVGKQYRFMIFDTILSAIPVVSNAHDLLAWVSRDQLKEYDLAPLDVPVLAGLMDQEVPDGQTSMLSWALPVAGSGLENPVELKDGPK